MSDNRNEDPIEEFFRKRVWNYDISYNESDWMDLKDRLDILDKQYARQKRRRWLAAATILLACLLGYFTYQNYTNINEIADKLNQETVPQNRQSQLAEESASPETPAPAVKERSPASGDQNADGNLETSRESPALAERQSEPGTGAEAPAGRTDAGEGEGEPGLRSIAAEGLTSDRLFIRELDAREQSVSGFYEDENNGPSRLTHLSVSEPAVPTGLPFSAANSGPVTPVNSQNRPTTRPSSPRLAVGLIMSPDLSTAGSISDFYEPGYKIGLQVEYHLTRNLAVTAGVMQSKVRYKAGSSDYSPPQGYWSSGIIPDETIGVCSLIDIPVSLKYDVLNLDRSRFFASAGLTSYIMQTEDYRFRYEQEYTGGQAQRWNERTGTRHWLSNANISIGYEYELRPNWSIRAEPFVKIPLKEVGWGNVKLYSMGTFVSLNYKIH